ncbi:hypothetical protein LIA77_11336 [Sarocladium implicatum]|nr:hypothetical protein LIA77_11336 [Sarocladium implicatum]
MGSIDDLRLSLFGLVQVPPPNSAPLTPLREVLPVEHPGCFPQRSEHGMDHLPWSVQARPRRGQICPRLIIVRTEFVKGNVTVSRCSDAQASSKIYGECRFAAHADAKHTCIGAVGPMPLFATDRVLEHVLRQVYVLSHVTHRTNRSLSLLGRAGSCRAIGRACHIFPHVLGRAKYA